MTPPAFVRGEEPKAPAQNRSMTSVWMFWLPAAPALKAVSTPYVMKNRIWRPYNSDKGALPRTDDQPYVSYFFETNASIVD